MGIAYIVIHTEVLERLNIPEYMIDAEGRVLEEIESRGATEIKLRKFPTRIEFTYSDEETIAKIESYVSTTPFLTIKKEFRDDITGSYTY